MVLAASCHWQQSLAVQHTTRASTAIPCAWQASSLCWRSVCPWPAARRQRFASGEPAAETFPQTPQTGPLEPPDAYVARRLARVRVQLDRLDTMLLAENDAQKLDRLASAQLRVSEQERILAGRPLPGSFKPSHKKPASGPETWASFTEKPSQPGQPKPACGVEQLPG